MRDLSCDITFPYNWNREFYCGERVQISVELRCAKVIVVKGVEMSVSCQNTDYDSDDQYRRYINDPDEENDCEEVRKSVTDIKTDIDLLGNYDRPVRFKTGTHIFNLNCWLPERISDHQNCEEHDQLCLNVSVRVRKSAKNEQDFSYDVNHTKEKRQTSFTWPGYYGSIRNYSNVAIDISSFHVSNVEEANNRYSREEDCDDSTFENWLGCIPMQGELSDGECSEADDC